MNSVGSINLSHFIVTIISLGTFFFIGSFIPIEALKKEGPLLKDYDNLKKLVDDIKNGDLIDDKISLNDFKGSGAYQTADKNIQNCINLAAKIGHNLKDDEIVHCFTMQTISKINILTLVLLRIKFLNANLNLNRM
jgi:hypothetical protein